MRGFSLVELSIVLVILGLLTGGILTGQSLIEAAELRSVTTDVERQKAAIYTFRDKYFALPGDMRNSFDFWGTAAGCTDSVNADANAAGCNGNGDGIIDDRAASGEDLRAVQFMAMAGLIEGSYTGVIVPSATNARQVGVNIFQTKFNNASLWLNHITTPQFGQFGNNLFLGLPNGVFPGAVALTPEQAWNMDTKLDDGEPDSGGVISIQGQTTCHDDDSYALTSDAVGCSVLFFLR